MNQILSIRVFASNLNRPFLHEIASILPQNTVHSSMRRKNILIYQLDIINFMGGLFGNIVTELIEDEQERIIFFAFFDEVIHSRIQA